MHRFVAMMIIVPDADWICVCVCVITIWTIVLIHDHSLVKNLYPIHISMSRLVDQQQKINFN